MTEDFLTRLAERALNVAPTVQPVLPSMFSPGGIAARDDLSGRPSREEPATRLNDSAETGLGSIETRPGDFSQEGHLEAPETPREQALIVQPEPIAGKVSVGSAQPARNKASSSKREADIFLESGDPKAHGPEQKDRAVEPADDGMSISKTSKDAPFQSYLSPAAVMGRAKNRGDEGPLRSEKGDRIVEAHPDQRPSSRVVKEDNPKSEIGLRSRQLAPRWTPSKTVADRGWEEPGNGDREMSGQDTTPPAPIIRVTIGRVEVRAVTQQAPAQARALAPGLRLSLEEYLRSRSGGKR